MPDETEKPLRSPAEPIIGEALSLRIEIEPADSYVYSNVGSISVSPWDIRINFADVTPTTEQNTKFKAVIGVVMPPEHAAGLAILLMDQLQVFENQFGPIRHPKWHAISRAALKRAAEQQATANQQEPAVKSD